MAGFFLNRRTLLAGSAAALASGVSGLWAPARATTLAPTRSMRGGSKNYQPDAPIV
jgi:hypothetical protein